MSKEPPYPRIIPWASKTLVAIVSLLVRLLVRLEVRGKEHFPYDDTVLITVNHLHHLDSPAMAATIPLPVWVLVGESYQKHIFGLLVSIAAGVIYVNRGEIDRNALRQALNVLKDGKRLAIAPEGTRSKTDALAEAKGGAAYLATRGKATIVPVAIWGTENIIPSWKRLKRAEVMVHYGKPYRLPEGRARAAQLEAYTAEIMTEIACLLPEQYHGFYANHPLLTEKLAARQPDT